MAKPLAKVIGGARFGVLTRAFFKRSFYGDLIFFVTPDEGVSRAFPVLESGEISRSEIEGGQPFQDEMVAIIDPVSISINEVHWSEG